MIYKDVLTKAVERIKGYCLKQVGCDKCRFNSDFGCALRETIPADWELLGNAKEKEDG